MSVFQDPKNKQFMLCDQQMQELFGETFFVFLLFLLSLNRRENEIEEINWKHCQLCFLSGSKENIKSK